MIFPFSQCQSPRSTPRWRMPHAASLDVCRVESQHIAAWDMSFPVMGVPKISQAIENGHRNSGFTHKMVIFHSYVYGYVWKCWVNTPNEIAIFHRDNDQQNQWGKWGTLFSDKPIWFNIDTHGDLGNPEESPNSQSLFQNEANHNGQIHVLSDSAKFHLQGISRIAAEQAIVSWEAANHQAPSLLLYWLPDWGLQISQNQNWGTKGPTLFLMVSEVLNHSQSVRSRILSHGHIDQASQAHIPLVSHMFRTRLESDVGWKMWWCGRHTCLRLNPPVTVLMRQRFVGIESIWDLCGKFVDLLKIGSKVWKPGWLKHHRTSWSRFSLIWAVRLPYLTAWANTPQQENRVAQVYSKVPPDLSTRLQSRCHGQAP